MHHGENRPFWFRRRVVAEHINEKSPDNGMQSVFDELVAVRLRLPNIHIAQPALREVGGKMHDQALWRVVAHTVHDALMKRSINWYILYKRIRHVATSISSETSSD